MGGIRLVAGIVAAACLSTPAWAVGNTVDVFDHPLKPVLTKNEPKLILYANQGTQRSVADTGELLAQHLRGVPYITVVHVDLRGVPGFLMGFARKLMQGSQAKANEKDSELARAAGLTPKPQEEQLHVVMEPDGAPHQMLGLASGFGQAMAVVLDRAGREILRARLPQDLTAVEKALKDAARETPPQPSASTLPALPHP
jgi:hypothetical protein